VIKCTFVIYIKNIRASTSQIANAGSFTTGRLFVIYIKDIPINTFRIAIAGTKQKN